MTEQAGKERKKTVRTAGWAVFSVALAFLTIRVIFHQNGSLSMGDLLRMLRHASLLWLLGAFLCMSGFIVFEGLALLAILKALGHPRTIRQGLLYSAGDLFFSAMTPSASGGQPASALFMRHHHIPAAVILASLLLNLIMYTTASVTVGLVSLLWKWDLFVRLDRLSKGMLFFSMGVFALLGILFLMLLCRGSLLRRVGEGLCRLLERMHLARATASLRARLARVLQDYQVCAEMAADKPRFLLRVYGYNLLQRLSQISVTAAVYHAIGCPGGAGSLDLWAAQAFAQIGSNCIPIPGGIGAADYLMLDGFGVLLARDTAYQLQVLSRGISFHLLVLICGVILLAGYGMMQGRHLKKKADIHE